MKPVTLVMFWREPNHLRDFQQIRTRPRPISIKTNLIEIANDYFAFLVKVFSLILRTRFLKD